jgi:excinuclease ABC subunit C
MPTLREQAAELPVVPGVYLFKSSEGEVLYVGKAVRLRERVRSYFAPDLEATRGSGLVQMVRIATTLDHETTGSEMEALLLEARLIRQYKPRYNIKLRDDKSFALVRIDMSQPFPPIAVAREKDLEELLTALKRERGPVGKVSQRVAHQEFFGPYLSAYSVRQALKTIRQIWPFRDCGPMKYATYAKLGHGCVFATLKLCDAPCAMKTTQEEYRKNIDQIRFFLRGDRESLLGGIQKQMDEAAAREDFERAATYRNRLQSLLHIQQVAQSRRTVAAQKQGKNVYDPETDLKVECYDISNNQGSYAVGSLIVGVIRQGKLGAVETRDEARKRFYLDNSQYKKFRIKEVEGISDVDSLKEVLRRRLRRGMRNEKGWELPDLLVLDGGKAQLSAAREIREELGLNDLKLATVAKGPTRRKVDLYGQWSELRGVDAEAAGLVAELLREEAHRFAITYYRNLHRKGALKRGN